MNKIEKNLLEKENNLSKYACKSKEAIRLIKESEDIRPAFFHDTDRIIHSLSYTRYINKTQVFSFNNNDHVSKRIVHVMLVSKIARTIGRLLNLNEDLIEAIALGHDIGHCPIGHVGESFLNEISYKELNEYFMHNIQSVRNYMYIEKNGNGLNLTIQVLDGIMCHNGEVLNNIYKPENKSIEKFLDEYNKAYTDKSVSKKMKPMTLEGCVVRISDVIAYIGRDIEDAINIGIIKRNNIPSNIIKILGDNNKDIINNIIIDIVNNSYDKPYIKLSNDIYNAIEELKEFNYKNIYDKANTEETKNIYKNSFIKLYNKYNSDLNTNNIDSDIVKYLDTMNEEYKKNNNSRIIIDYIAGMTDEYFIKKSNICCQQEKIDKY